jgi:amidase
MARMSRILLISSLVMLVIGAPWARQAPPAFPIEELTVAQLQEAMAAGRYTSRRLVEIYTERINAVDRKGPTLRSVIELNPDALSIAETLDAERTSGRVRGPLHGIPVLIKDNIDTGDRMMTTAGSLALAGPPAPRDAFIVTKLRAAGAVILGKTNLSEWANFRSTKSTSGWSARGGQVNNPYALDRNPCGSSSGTGAAVAANLTAIGVGTETDGSIVCPSAANALVGIKPTIGLVSRTGISSTAITFSAPVQLRQPSPVIRASPCRRASFGGYRLASLSLGARGAKRNSLVSPTPTSKPRSIASRRRLQRR